MCRLYVIVIVCLLACIKSPSVALIDDLMNTNTQLCSMLMVMLTTVYKFLVNVRVMTTTTKEEGEEEEED